jgi:hypothetical protein
MAPGPSLPISAGAEQRSIIRELVSWAEHTTLAISGAHGLNVTQMKQATTHLVEMRRLLGTTSGEEPDDRESRWPEGEP